MNSDLIGVVAAVVDTRQLTLYTTTGEKIYIPQGDPRLAKIINHITPILSSGPGVVAYVSVASEEVSTYREYEKQSGGFVKLFRVARKALAEFFSVPETEEPMKVNPQVIGSVPSPINSIFVTRTSVIEEGANRARMMSAVTQILAHAQTVPVSDPKFTDKDSEDSTMVAIVDDQVIPGVEALKPQMARSVAIGSPTAMNAFMKRLAAVSSKRNHSAQDLLKFLTKGDLPIADDGSIVIYKILRRQGNSFVDCHTGRVTQKVGSYVCMAEDLVDPDRRVDCSNGLHVARRGYLANFSGDVVVLAKVNPEDVIAVPEYDHNKMRVCGYHILFELSADAFSKLKSNRPFTDSDEAKVLLGRAIAGDHPAPKEMVLITEQHGGGVVITPRVGTFKNDDGSVQINYLVTPTEALSEDDTKSAPAVDPKAVSRQVIEAKAQVETRAQKAQRLYETFLKAKSKKATTEAAQALLNYKKSTKLGWVALGLPADVGVQLS